MKNFLILLTIFIFCALRVDFEVVQKNKAQNELDYYKDKYEKLDNALVEISAREYTDDYQCLDFSRDLAEELKNKDIQAEIVIGESPKTAFDEKTVHAWVGIWIDPQYGSFTKNYYLNEKTTRTIK